MDATIARLKYQIGARVAVTSRNHPVPDAAARQGKAIYLTIVMVVAACAQVPPDEPEQTPPPAPVVAPVAVAAPAIDRDLLYALLDRAEIALAADELTSLEGDSAQSLYDRALELDPDNEEAMRGYERIVERFVAQAMRALERRQFATARSMLARARLIDPNHPSIAPTAVQIELIATAALSKLLIHPQWQEDELAAELQSFAHVPDGLDCRFIIWASNDAQGRRIYQALRSTSSVTRLRAEILIRSPTGVEKQCFPG